MEFEDGYRLSESELMESGPVIEAGPSTVVVPEKGGKKSIFEWPGQTQEGTVKLAVIRPCVSRGKRIRGLPPIYTQEMLAENAGVYSGWLMYMDHLTEAIQEALAELSEGRGRLTSELGGRVIRSWYDPTFSTRSDDGNGYKPGAVVAEALPQPGARAMLEADPEILHVSHNAWPKGAVVGTRWGQKGAIIEGIRSTPEGSVDWVPRGGAGGHVLQEDDRLAVSVLRSHYDARPVSKKLPEIKSREQLLESLREENPELLESIGGEAALQERVPEPPATGTALTVEQLTEKLEEQEQRFNAKIEEQRETAEEAAERLLQERAEAQTLAEYALELIEGAGLPPTYEQDMRIRYSVLPSGPSAALQLAESAADADEEKDARHFIRESITRDLKHCQKLIEESGGTVRVKGLGATDADPEGEGGGKGLEEHRSEWVEEIGGFGRELKEGEKSSDLVREMLQEGVAR